MSAKTLVGIVLAAGESVRMGRPKQLLPFEGATLLNFVITQAERSRLDEVVVVTGANAEEVEDQVDLSRAVVARNPDYRRGNMSSLATGAGVVPDADAVLLLMGDMPGVDTAVIDRFVDLWRDEQPWAAVAAYQDGMGHPFLLSAPALEAALELIQPKALWTFLVAEPGGDVRHLDVAGLRPRDVDTPEDYEALLAEGWRA
jgi:molybdenum cofactor cytidylyltransferase